MAQWSGKTIGPLLGYKIFLYTIKWFGVNTAYIILKVVTFYYYLFAKKSRNFIIDFYTKALHVSTKEAAKLCKKNFQIFGQTLVDRNAFLLGKEDQYTYTFQNEESLLQLNEIGKGGVLLSAHLGNWETAGNLLKKRVSGKINVLMLDSEVEKVKQFMEATTGGSHFNIIPIKNDLSHIIRIKNALGDNELIAIHADRTFEGSKTIACKFFGKQVNLPYGPFLIASKFNAPITFVYAVKGAKFHYDLSATDPITEKLKPEQIAQQYVDKLEQMVKKYPEQWFNFYNYFEQ